MKAASSSTVEFFPPTSPISPPTDTVTPSGSRPRTWAVNSAVRRAFSACCSARVGFDLSDVQYTKAAGGGIDRPRLEGVKVDGHWAIIYSPYDIGCALERQQGLDCKGYTHESAMRIAANIVIYATPP